MNVIESKMIAAISEGRNWSQDNTEVIADEKSIQVLLHGSFIVKIEKKDGKVTSGYASLAGYNTQTTRSRINAVCTHFGVERIHNVKRVPMRGDNVVPEWGWFQIL